MTLLFKLFALSLAAFALSVAMSLSPSFANEYSRGSLYCDDFQEAEEFYQKGPDDKYYAAGYVICLFARGQGNDHALAMDIAENTATRFNDVDTAWRYARFIATGGKFEEYDMSNLNEAIMAFARVWLFITETPHYPMGYSHSEPAEQWTLYTIHSLTFFNYNRFLLGVGGSYNYKKIQSPNYEGDREQLELWPQYADHTLYSLEQVIDKGRICANLPWRDYFDRELYDKFTADCRLMKAMADSLHDTEIRRLQLLQICEDILNCSEYDDLNEVMLSIAKETREKRGDIYDP